jgi:hypothetical protein
VLVAEPFVAPTLAAARRAIFTGYPTVSDAYASLEFVHGSLPFGAAEWRNLFEAAGAIGPVRMRAFEKEKLGVWPSYTEIKQQIAQKLEISFDMMRDIETQSKFGWKVRSLASNRPLRQIISSSDFSRFLTPNSSCQEI